MDFVVNYVSLVTGSTGPHKPDPPEGITKLNDSVWIFANPPSPNVDIIFFHGLHIGDYEDAFWKSWQSRNTTVVWPKYWLSQKLSRARILSISYNSSATRWRAWRAHCFGSTMGIIALVLRLA